MVTQKKKKSPVYKNYDENPVEAVRDIAGGVVKGVVSDLVGGVAKNTISQIFGTKSDGELRPDETFNFDEFEWPKERTRPVIQRQPEMLLFSVREQEIDRQIEALRQELKAMISSSNLLSKEIEKAVMEVPVDPGVYHINFFERLRKIIKLLRQQINESCTWLQLMTSRKKQRGYWNMFKKHGTTFGLSSERTLATQTG